MSPTFLVRVEIELKSNIKYEYCNNTKALIVDRFLSSPMAFPQNYGSIIGTLGHDNDELDAIIIFDQPLSPGTLVKTKVVGGLYFECDEGVDINLLCIPLFSNKKNEDITLRDINDSLMSKIIHFFSHYVDLEEGAWSRFVKILDEEESLDIIRSSSKNLVNY